MPIYFFDTSALQHRYVDGKHSRRIRRVVSDKRNECYIADWTILEIGSAIARRCRQEQLRDERFDVADLWFWTDVSNATLKVRETGTREILRARDLIRYAGVIRRRKISSGDALVAVCCLELALESGRRVAFYMEDLKLYRVLSQIKAYTSALDLRIIRTPSNSP